MIDRQQLQHAGRELWRQLAAETQAPADSVWRARATAAAAMLAGLAVQALLWDAPLEMSFLLFVTAAGMVFGRSALPVVMGLALVWGGGFLLEGGEWFANDRVRFADLIITLALLAYILYGLRCVELNRKPLAGPRLKWRLAPSQSPNRRPQVRLRPLAGSAIRLILPAAIAFVLLWVAPWDAMDGNSPRLVPSAYRAMVFFWGLGVVALVLGAAFSILQWRRLSRSQAALYARWVLARELSREQRAVERARAAHLRQQ